MYIHRHIENSMRKLSGMFPAVLVTGPRQVGKSTMLKHAFSDTPYISMDSGNVRAAADSDPAGFLSLKRPPLSIDEVQKVPALFDELKSVIDDDRRPGMFFLSGSQSFRLMKGVSESLAGRISLLRMIGLSGREINGDSFSDAFLPTKEYFEKRKQMISSENIWDMIHKGSMPELYSNPAMEWESYYDAYVTTYIDRDVRDLAQVGNLRDFRRIMTAAAARTGQLLNYSDLAKDVGVDQTTIKRWISILETSEIIYLLKPFSLNITKRVVKTPKLYFTDTGLCSFLCRWLTPDTLAAGAMAGAMFETFVLGEILKSYFNSGREPDIYFFRNTDGAEVDFLFYENGALYPLEVKMHSNADKKDIRHFKTLRTFFPELEISGGGVIDIGKELLPIADGYFSIPIGYI